MAANPLYYTKRHSMQIQAACPQMTQERYMETDDPADYINLNDDANMRLAADVLARKLSDSDVLNRIGKHAIELNLEVARRYTSEDDLKELGVKS